MTWDFTLAFGLGLIAGSFVNVLTHRMPLIVMRQQTGEDNLPRYDLCWPASHCPHCNTPLKLWHNIPVISYLWLKGKCAFCHQHIGLHYPIVELITAGIWLACSWHWGFTTTGLCWALFVTILLASSIIDWKTTLLPDDLTQPLVWSGLISCASGCIQLPLEQSIWGTVLGYTSLRLVATLFELMTGKIGMGAGDFKLFAGLGSWLGPLALLPIIFLASISGILVGLWLKFFNKLGGNAYIPFGPFLALSGCWITFVGINPITPW